MQACSFNKFCLGMCNWTDCPRREGSMSSSEHLAMPGYTHEHDVDKEHEPLAPLQPHPNTSHNPRWSNCAGSKTSSTLEPSSERFSTFVNNEEACHSFQKNDPRQH